jgi:hypothetical protein
VFVIGRVRTFVPSSAPLYPPEPMVGEYGHEPSPACSASRDNHDRNSRIRILWKHWTTRPLDHQRQKRCKAPSLTGDRAMIPVDAPGVAVRRVGPSRVILNITLELL